MFIGLPIKYRDHEGQEYRDGYIIDTVFKKAGNDSFYAFACTIDKESGFLGITRIAGNNIIVDTSSFEDSSTNPEMYMNEDEEGRQDVSAVPPIEIDSVDDPQPAYAETPENLMAVEESEIGTLKNLKLEPDTDVNDQKSI